VTAVTLEATCHQDGSVLAPQVRTTTTSTHTTRRPNAADSTTRCPDVDGVAVDFVGFASVEDALTAGIELPCQFADPDLFFADAPEQVESAKALCADCPVRDVCLAAALARREPWGVWGGEWFLAGEAVGYKRPRGRPRKDYSPGPRPTRAPRGARPANRKEVAA
jgi:WhiB family redox-sensing transcriptional regulator